MAGITQGEALRLAVKTISELRSELDSRQEREEELFSSILSLVAPLRQLSGTLYGTQGSFGVGLTNPDPDIDKSVFDSRPAIVVNRASALLNLATNRLNELYLEHEESSLTAQELIAGVNQLRVATAESVERRNKLLILGGSYTKDRSDAINSSIEPYLGNSGELTLDEVYETANVELDDDEEQEFTNVPSQERRVKRAKKKSTKKYGFMFR